ncbi:drug transporter [Coprinopsis cinerea okayama7|uniref:Drug transporter n=1 Tax=Coprinopsis cinerea (strain Okayama-7 / 130 / ATCC MYA-4618 / FGSC 9003) TaxID=240176 RepID=A8NA01_COPC7|nr:drug transporter [Coprinopsis cinerea okayama7\|eukprot:XP_001831657.2 drug transporter [Coprinopsis cinerea okayama7\
MTGPRSTHSFENLPANAGVPAIVVTSIEASPCPAQRGESQGSELADPSFLGKRERDWVERIDDSGLGTPDSVTVTGDSVLYVEFTANDSRDPQNFSQKKKWLITLIACFTTFVSSSTTTAYNMGFPSMMRDLNATDFQATVGLAVWSLGYAVVPLVTAPFSEELGRRPVYIGSMLAFFLCYIPIACATNIYAVQGLRFLQGAVGSTGAIMVGGTIADIWAPEDRNLPMSLFSFMVIGSNGLGALFGGWIEYNESLQWRWIQWTLMIICGVCTLLLPLMGETRSSVILTKIARRRRKETGDKRYRALAEVERESLSDMIKISCTRPLRLLFTEPIVAGFSIWVGFAWGVLYCFVESISSVFQDLHQFHLGQIGSVFAALTVGALLGFVLNVFVQERLYRIHHPRRDVEARLFSACLAGIIFPLSMVIYALSCSSSVHWMGLVVGISLFSCSAYLIYVASFTYIVDWYVLARTHSDHRD